MMGKSWVDRVTNKVFGRIKKHNIVSKIFVMTHLSKRLTVYYLTTLYKMHWLFSDEHYVCMIAFGKQEITVGSGRGLFQGSISAFALMD
jgi:hypothetical protein